MHKPETLLENDSHNILWDFEIQTDDLILTRRPDHVTVDEREKKKTCWIVNFAVLADYRVKTKDIKKRDKCLYLDRELKNLWKMGVTVIPIVISALGTIPKGLIRRLEKLEFTGRAETIQTTTLPKSPRILRRVLETWGDLVITLMKDHQITQV